MVVNTEKKRKRVLRDKVVIANYEIQKEFIKIDDDIIKKIGIFADKYNVQIYIVGGYVRDLMLKKHRTDYDFTIVGDAIEFAEKLAKDLKTKPVLYKKFRTALVPMDNIKLEFVGTRKEDYNESSRKPIVSEGTLEDDLKRRDFTINAMAISINQDSFGELIDLYNGRKDLETRIIKTPLNPEVTFSDDPLRMMRAARFASQLNFQLDKVLIATAQRICERLEIISRERITDEMLKILASDKPSIGFNLLSEMKLLKWAFPDLANLAGVERVMRGEKVFSHKDILQHTLQVVDKIAESTDNIWLRFAALVHDIAKPKTKQFSESVGWTFHGHEDLGAKWTKKIFRDLKLPFEHIDYVERLVRLHQRPMVLVDDGVSDSAIRRLAYQADAALEDLFALCKADITTNNPKLSLKYLRNYEIVKKKVLKVQEKDKLREFQSPVRGEEIMEICNINHSLAVGIIKSAIEEAILDGIIPNDYDAAKEFFLQNKDQWLADIQSGKLDKHSFTTNCIEE